MKILITGGAGYIGSHTIIEIIEKTDFEVISADNFCNSSPDTFTRIENITGKKVKNYNVNLAEATESKRIFEENPDIDGIIHFAALKSVGESVLDPLGYIYNNLNSLINLLQLSQNSNCKYLIFSSSCSVYGNLDKLPVTEETPFSKPESPYGFTKQAGEQILTDFANANPSFKTISLRYFNPVGAHSSGLIGELPLNEPNNLVPVITQTAVNSKSMTVHGGDYDTRDGTCIRDYVHVTDIAAAHLLALQYLIEDKNKKNHDVFNLGTGEGVSVLEMIQAFEKTSGEKLKYTIGERRKGDVVAIYSDSSKAAQLLGWKTEFGIDHMLESAWKWQQHLLDVIGK